MTKIKRTLIGILVMALLIRTGFAPVTEVQASEADGTTNVTTDETQSTADWETYDADGYNAYGYDRDGYDKDGYKFTGYNRDGFDREGYPLLSYEKDGVLYAITILFNRYFDRSSY